MLFFFFVSHYRTSCHLGTSSSGVVFAFTFLPHRDFFNMCRLLIDHHVVCLERTYATWGLLVGVVRPCHRTFFTSCHLGTSSSGVVVAFTVLPHRDSFNVCRLRSSRCCLVRTLCHLGTSRRCRPLLSSNVLHFLPHRDFLVSSRSFHVRSDSTCCWCRRSFLSSFERLHLLPLRDFSLAGLNVVEQTDGSS